MKWSMRNLFFLSLSLANLVLFVVHIPEILETVIAMNQVPPPPFNFWILVDLANAFGAIYCAAMIQYNEERHY